MPKGISRRDFLRTTARAGVAAGLAGTSFLKASPQGTYDLVIRNARVCDGTGAEAVPSDIGIRGERIAHIGSLNGARARRILDAEGHVASPGFIDIHTHSDLELLVNPRGESKIHQGVTTELTGNCGSSAFPIRLPLSDEEKAMAERLNLKIEWTDLSGYHAALSRKGTAVNLGTLIGNGTLRHVVVGDVDREPSDAEMEEMKTHVARAMEQGAFGLSTGLEYTPSGFASTDEVIALCRVVARYGGFYATHMRSEDKSVIEAVAEAIHIAEAAGLPLQISHFKAVGRPNWWKLPMMIDLVERAAGRGLRVTADRYPYLAYSTGLSIHFPKWALDGGMARFIARLKDAKTRESMKAETLRKVAGTGWERIVITNTHKEHNKKWVGASIRDAAARTGKDPYTFVCDLLVDEGRDVSHVGFGMDETNTETVLKHPLVMLGSDGSSLAPYGPLGEGQPHPRNYGAFPRFLARYVRERKLLPLGQAIKKITSMPASRMGLRDRGILKAGAFADIVVFDPETITDRATFTSPHQYPDGIDWVIVNGQVVVDHNEHTGKLPGKILHGPGYRERA